MNTSDGEPERTRAARGTRRIPRQSVFYERLIPVAMVLLGILMLVILLFALVALFGLIPFRW